MKFFRDSHFAAKDGLLIEFYNIFICYYKVNGLPFLQHDLDNIVKLFTDLHIMSVTAFVVTEQVAHRNIALFYYYVITKFGNRYEYDEDRERLSNKMTRLDIKPTGGAGPDHSLA